MWKEWHENWFPTTHYQSSRWQKWAEPHTRAVGRSGQSNKRKDKEPSRPKSKSGAKRKPDEGCFVCGKTDQFAKQCPESHINKKCKKKDDTQEGESYVGYSKTEREEGDNDQESSDNNIFFASAEEPSKWPIIDSGAS